MLEKLPLKLLAKSLIQLTVLFFLFAGSISLTAQKDLSELGLPKITNYGPNDYNGGSQVWSIIQDDRGVMYFGIDPGLIEYDGANWRTLRFNEKSNSVARSMAKDANGRIYIGAQGDLGYLQVRPEGQTQFVSLLDKVPVGHRVFADVWNTNVCGDKVFFNLSDKLLIWEPGMDSLQVYEAGPGTNFFHHASNINDRYLVRQWGVGLLEWKEDRLELMPDGARFADERVYVMLPYDEDKILIGARGQGFFLHDGEKITPFSTEIDDFLKEFPLYLPGEILNSGHFVINTIGGGAFIMDRNGRLIQRIDQSAGLRDNFVTHPYVDRNGALWLALTDGFSRVETSSPLSYYKDNIGINSTILSIINHNETLYAGAEGPLYYFDQKSNRFNTVTGAGAQTFWFLKYKDQLLAANYDGVQMIQQDRAIPIRENLQGDYSATYMHPYSLDSSLIFVGVTRGLSVLKYHKNGSWEDKGFVPGVNVQIWNIAEDQNNSLWVGDQVTGVYKISFPNWPDFSTPQIKHYNINQGLPQDAFIRVVDGEIFAMSTSGLYKHDPLNDQFVKDTTFGEKATYLSPDLDGRLWVNMEHNKGLTLAHPLGDGSYRLEEVPFKPLSEDIITLVYPEPDGKQVWIGSNEGLIRYDRQISIAEAPIFNALIRKVSIGGDSLLQTQSAPSPIAYKYNKIQFDFAAPFFNRHEKLEYQTWLEGLDKSWSPWSKRADREYLNLSSGDYRFHVRARNLFGQETEETVYEFSILPPWYQSWWAILLYILAAGLGIYGIVDWRTRQLKAREEQLKKEVAERTQQLTLRVEELSLVNQISQALAKQLELDVLIPLVGDQMRDLFKADMVYVALLNSQTQMIDFPYGYGDDFPAMKFGEGLTSKIIKSGEALLINEDVSGSYSKLGIQEIGKKSASFLGVPIPVGKDIIGVISIQSTQETSRFGESNKKLLTTIAAHVGVAIHNAQLFEETQQARSEAEAANEAKSIFLSIVSHELRTPLTSIIGFTKLNKKNLEDKIIPDLKEDASKAQKVAQKTANNLDIVSSEGDRLLTLINELLDLAKIESGNIEWNIAEVDPKSLIERATNATNVLFEQKPELELVTEVPENLPVIKGDPDRLLQVLINLISNAVKFTDKGYVKIGSFSMSNVQNSELMFFVEDTGTGIPQDKLEKVFERFQQVEENQAGKPKGTGLGLPICKEIVAHHGGKIWVESAVDLKEQNESIKAAKGSTFKFTLPLSVE